jgi:antitoxin (DNA-binding transcriptional repressor) of toxin-antitoxin stability system
VGRSCPGSSVFSRSKQVVDSQPPAVERLSDLRIGRRKRLEKLQWPVKTATTSETKNSLSALLDGVRHGETVLVTDRRRPVARLEPVVSAGDPGPDEGRLARLERAGVIRRATRGRLDEVLRVPPPAPEPGGDLLAAVIEERRRGR